MSHKMNWIEALEKELRLLSEEDRSDIILNYQEQIKAMLNEGKSEDEILQRLGSPKEVAKEVKLALGIEHQENLFEKIEQGANEALNFFADVVSRQDCEGKKDGRKINLFSFMGCFFCCRIWSDGGCIWFNDWWDCIVLCFLFI